MRRTKADRCQVLTKSKPLISILIPSRGRVAMLKRCVESYKSAVTPQDDYEILIRVR
jgi:glycosyltransferase involved in cell wall biosynthesis